MLTINCGADLIVDRIYFILSGEMERDIYERSSKDYSFKVFREDTYEDYFADDMRGLDSCGSDGREAA
jgi:hypothetical protein